MPTSPFDVIDQALRRLYGRINGATATDATYFRVALKALASLKRPVEAPQPVPQGPVGVAGEVGPDDSGLMAPEAPEATPKPSDNPLNGMSIPEIQDFVESGAVSAEEALEWERVDANRKTLIAWLEKEMAGPEDDEDDGNEEEDDEDDEDDDEEDLE